MKPLPLIVALTATAGILLFTGWRDHKGATAYAAPTLTWRQAEILTVRARVHACQARLGLHRSPVARRVVTGGRPVRALVLRRWRQRLELCQALERKLRDPVQAILAVFGPRGWEAVEVARCETGGTFSVYARNGQYLGLFQMGSHARALYGHGYTPLQQARAAYRYFVDAGRDWSPWACKP